MKQLLPFVLILSLAACGGGGEQEEKIPTPSIKLITPGQGDFLGGEFVTIEGDNLETTTEVRFGLAVATNLIRNKTQLTMTTPSYMPDQIVGAVNISDVQVDVIVVTPAGNVTAAKAFTFVSQPIF